MFEKATFFVKRFGSSVGNAAITPLYGVAFADLFMSKICKGKKVYGFFKEAHFPIPSTENKKSFKRRALAVAMRMVAVICAFPFLLACAVCAVVMTAIAIPVGVVVAALTFSLCFFIGIPLFIGFSIYGWGTGKEFNLNDKANSIFASPRLGGDRVEDNADITIVVFAICIAFAFAVVICPVVVLCALVVALPALLYVGACTLASKIAHAVSDENSPYDLEGDVVSVDKKFPFKIDDFRDSELLKATYSLATDPFVCRS